MRNPFRYFDSSPEVIRLAVMMYIRYPLSLRRHLDRRDIFKQNRSAAVAPSTKRPPSHVSPLPGRFAGAVFPNSEGAF